MITSHTHERERERDEQTDLVRNGVEERPLLQPLTDTKLNVHQVCIKHLHRDSPRRKYKQGA